MKYRTACRCLPIRPMPRRARGREAGLGPRIRLWPSGHRGRSGGRRPSESGVRVAVRGQRRREQKDRDSLLLTCNMWRQTAENVAESLTRGMRVIVSAACGSGTKLPSPATVRMARNVLLYSLVSLGMPGHS